MLCKILKAFPYAHDGHSVVSLPAGALVEIDDGAIDGLTAEGFIGEATAEDLAANGAGVDIPADWSTLQWSKLQAMARAIAGGPVKDKKAAEAVITAELDRRAAG